ncbi:NrsF family protein [Methylocapsa aurea]|uniref:NrsF family protein n=1 Tax=Methylocapsa aurea TaxID=663610 RepID=UPI000567104A|nr:NrsF family protein [Methylocapsa aurea]
MRTNVLIQRLSDQTTPVRRLPPPLRRLVLWLGIAAPSVMIMVAVMSPRPDLIEKLGESRYLLEQGAAVVTALTAAFAAFSAGVPGRPRWPLLLPLAPLALWLGSLGQGCLSNWLSLGPEGLTLQPDWMCLPAIALTGAVPAIAITVMIRRGAPLLPRATVALAALAAAALGNVGLRLFHPQDASLMVLVWQFGSVMLLTTVGCCFGRLLLRWRPIRA